MNKLLNLKSVVTKGRLASTLANYRAANEPILEYKKGSKERQAQEEALKRFLKTKQCDDALFDVPICVGDKEIRTKEVEYQTMPFDHKVKVAKFYHADQKILQDAIDNAMSARASWEAAGHDYRANIMLKAADMLATTHRADLLAATMLGQGKTVFQAEIDAACELIDFLRFNVQFLYEALRYKPTDVGSHTINHMELRGLEGFVAAVAPFNFTAIAGNLCTAPALTGNVVLFKPSHSSVLSSYLFYKLLREAGLPPGIIQFVPSQGAIFGETITRSPHLAGVNFTGSVPTFSWLWKRVGENLPLYRNFPKLAGECGGKNFHLMHPSADLENFCLATVKSAYEYSGQKCSAAARLYVPESKWPQVRQRLGELVSDLKIDSPLHFDTFTSAVIDKTSFKKITGYVDYGNKNLKLVYGGKYDGSRGYFIQPTLYETSDPRDRIMKEEIFGPVLSAYVYKDAKYDDVMELVDTTTPFALTGAIFAQDEEVLKHSMKRLRQACGNMYINDKSTGAVVNQQPFGGSRMSGTNDKPGGPSYVLKWTSPLSVKRFNGKQPSVILPSML